jgi:hypothetical protein
MALVSAYLAFAPVIAPATSATAFRELNPYEIQGDRFSNYDFPNEEYKRNNIDWAIDLIFAHGGTVGLVKETLNSPFDYGKQSIDLPGFDPKEFGASDAYARVNDGPQGSGGEWDSDAGRKTNRCETKIEPNIYHYRVYAPPDVDHFVNQKWGNYVIASSHIDHNECPSGIASNDGTPSWSGRSEHSERIVAYNSSLNFPNAIIYPDKVWLRNYQPKDETTNHYWLNDGKATFINVFGRR